MYSRTRLHFALIFMAHTLGAMTVLGVLVSGSLIAADLNLSAVQIGALASAYSATLAAGSLPAGVLADLLGTRASLSLSAAVLSLGAFWVAASGSFLMLCLGMAVCGAGYTLINPAAGRAIQSWFSLRWRGTLMGIKQTGVPLGGFLGTAAAGLGARYGWRLGVLSVAGLSASCALLFWILLPRNEVTATLEKPAAGIGVESSSRISVGRLQGVFSLPHLGRANLASGLTNGGQFTLWAFLSETLRQAGGLSLSAGTFCVGFLQLGTVLGRLFWGFANDRFFGADAARCLRWLCLNGLAVCTGLLILSPVNAWVLAPVISLMLGFTVCSATGLHITLTMALAPASQTGSAIGYTMLITNIGGVLVPPLFGLALDMAGSQGMAFGLGSTMGLAAVLLPTLGGRPVR